MQPILLLDTYIELTERVHGILLHIEMESIFSSLFVLVKKDK